ATQLVIAQQRAIPRVAAIDTEIDSVVLRGRGRRKERHHQRRCRCYPHQHFHTILLTWVRLADTLDGHGRRVRPATPFLTGPARLLAESLPTWRFLRCGSRVISP